MFENRVLTRIFGRKRDVVTGEGRRLHEELYDLYFAPRIMRWPGHMARMVKCRGAYRILVGRPEGKIQLGTPRHRWEDNIKFDLQEVGWEGAGLIHLAQDRDMGWAVVNALMSLRVP
jgi:hypothetical protein